VICAISKPTTEWIAFFALSAGPVVFPLTDTYRSVFNYSLVSDILVGNENSN